MTPESTTRAKPSGPAGFLVIGRKRPGFDPDWAERMDNAAWAACREIGLEVFRPETRTVDDDSLRRAIGEIRQAGCETLIVLQPAMGDGRLAPVLTQLFDAPVVIWATPERPDGGKVSSCSLVGAHVFATILRQMDHPFELAYGHPEDDRARNQLAAAVRLCQAAVRLRRAKVGLVGGHAPGFVNMHVDPSQLARQLGVRLLEIGLDDFFTRIDGQADAAVADDVARAETLEIPYVEGLGREDLAPNSRYYLAMRDVMAEENLDALAVRCWPEMPQRFGHWPYLAMMRLADEGSAVALEGDADGAISCLVGRLLGLGPGYISDWLEHDGQSIVLWHPGHAPTAMCRSGTLRLGRHFNNRLPLVVDAELAPDRPITLFRLWRCDDAYRMTAAEARTIPPRRELAGANGLAVFEDRDVGHWFEFLLHEGMPHHVTILPGHHQDLLKRLARLVRVRWVA